MSLTSMIMQAIRDTDKHVFHDPEYAGQRCETAIETLKSQIIHYNKKGALICPLDESVVEIIGQIIARQPTRKKFETTMKLCDHVVKMHIRAYQISNVQNKRSIYFSQQKDRLNHKYL